MSHQLPKSKINWTAANTMSPGRFVDDEKTDVGGKPYVSPSAREYRAHHLHDEHCPEDRW